MATGNEARPAVEQLLPDEISEPGRRGAQEDRGQAQGEGVHPQDREGQGDLPEGKGRLVQPHVVARPVRGVIGQIGGGDERRLQGMLQEVLGDQGVKDLVPVGERGVVEVAEFEEEGRQQDHRQDEP